jgi:hypothetical protein
LATSIRCVLITPLGSPVEPEVNRIFATVSGPTRAKASSTRAPASFSRSFAIGVASAPTAASAGAKRGESPVHTRPGLSSSKIALSFAKSFDISE